MSNFSSQYSIQNESKMYLWWLRDIFQEASRIDIIHMHSWLASIVCFSPKISEVLTAWTAKEFLTVHIIGSRIVGVCSKNLHLPRVFAWKYPVIPDIFQFYKVFREILGLSVYVIQNFPRKSQTIRTVLEYQSFWGMNPKYRGFIVAIFMSIGNSNIICISKYVCAPSALHFLGVLVRITSQDLVK